MFAVCVTLAITPGQMDAFLPLMQAQARNSLSLEPGCHRFDIASNGDEVFLYELYDDEVAFQTHLATDHFRQFDTGVADLVAAKTVKTYDVLTAS